MNPLNHTIFLMAGLTVLAVPGLASSWDKKTTITFGSPVEFPGGTVLSPGSYVLKLHDSPGNRHIVKVYNHEENRLHAIVFAIPSIRMEPADKTIITFYETPKDEPTFIRTWFYPGDTVGQEFPYRKAGFRGAPYLPDRPPSNILIPRAREEPAGAAALESRIPEEPAGEPSPESRPPEKERNDLVAPEPRAESSPPRSDPEPELLAQASPPPAPGSNADAGAPSPSADQRDTARAAELPQTASAAPYLALAGSLLFAAGLAMRFVRGRR